MLYRRVMACLMTLLTATGMAAGTEVTVNADRVNLRSRPELESEQVGQVGYGTKLTLIAEHGDWLEVVPPDEISLWIHRDFVDGGAVNTRRLNVRTGPSINHRIAGHLVRGDTIVERDRFGEWIEIAPPEGASVYIHRDLVDVPPPPLPVPAPRPPVDPPQPAPAPAVTRDVPAEPERGPPPPPGLDLIPVEGQGEAVRFYGEIRATPVLMRIGTTPHRLIRRDDTRVTTLCFLSGNSHQLDSLIGTTLTVYGRAYWIRGRDYPVVAVERFETTAPPP